MNMKQYLSRWAQVYKHNEVNRILQVSMKTTCGKLCPDLLTLTEQINLRNWSETSKNEKKKKTDKLAKQLRGGVE